MTVLAVVRRSDEAEPVTFFSAECARKWGHHHANAVQRVQCSHYYHGRHIGTVFVEPSMLGQSIEAWQQMGGVL